MAQRMQNLVKLASGKLDAPAANGELRQRPADPDSPSILIGRASGAPICAFDHLSSGSPIEGPLFRKLRPLSLGWLKPGWRGAAAGSGQAYGS